MPFRMFHSVFVLKRPYPTTKTMRTLTIADEILMRISGCETAPVADLKRLWRIDEIASITPINPVDTGDAVARYSAAK